MRSALTLVAVVLVGLFGATSIGYASYLVSRDSVGLPVTKLELSSNLAPPRTTRRKAAKPKRRTTSTANTPGMPSQITTSDDHGGSANSGKGSDDSGHGGDDD
jgi:hypothetical protein